MSDLLAARSQMGVSLAFHIIFAVAGIAMPVMMVVAERQWQVTGHAVYLDLAQRWAKGTAILFAVGAVSGTVLSFELGLLWPKFMAFAGSIIGLPFGLEASPSSPRRSSSASTSTDARGFHRACILRRRSRSRSAVRSARCSWCWPMRG